MDFTVKSDGDGVLLRSYLKRIRISGKLVSHLKAVPNGICVNGEHVTVRRVLREGDVISLAIEDTEFNESITPVELPIEILYEDADLIVCSKPPFMPTHPSCNHHDDTLANALAFYFEKQGQSFQFRPVNRLDRNTSGVVMVAKNARAAAFMHTEMTKGRIEKTYFAIAEGELSGHGTIETYLCRTEKSIIVRRVCEKDDEGAQYALTEYTSLCSDNGMSALSLRLHTGRTHQIRVHLAHLGHSLVGDDLYGKESPYISRQALHARTLSFNRPSDDKRITVNAPLPEDIKKVAEMCGFEE